VERITILGIPVDAVSQQEAIRCIVQFCRSAGQFHIATPNPEMLVEASKNPEFKKVLQNTAMNIPDGAGLVWALRRGMRGRRSDRGDSSRTSVPSLTSVPPPTSVVRLTGTDLLQKITTSESRLCPPERIFLLGAAPGVAEKAAVELKKRNPAIRDIGTWSGSPSVEDEAEIIRRINTFSFTPRSSGGSGGGHILLFVAFGAPKQDLWIARNLKKLPSVKIAMGVGGALDFLSGRKKRAPRWMQAIGIEWLWRLILEPRRVGRIWNAVVVFPWMIYVCHPEEPPSRL